MSDFFKSDYGDATKPDLLSKLSAGWLDAAYDRSLTASLGEARRRFLAEPRDILVAGVEVPSRPRDIHEVVEALQQTRHRVSVSIVPMGRRSKFDNVNAAIAGAEKPLQTFDWIIVADDDVSLPTSFLDDFILLAEAARLDVAQPAHRCASHMSYRLTKRRARSLVRTSRFVEIGPLTAFSRRTYDDLIPFPHLRWCYGLDVLWAQLAETRGWRLGIVDGAPLAHLRPIAASYDAGEAIAEAEGFFRHFGVTVSRRELLSGDEVALR